MNVSEIPRGLVSLSEIQVPPEINQIGEEVIKAAAFTLITTELLYFSIYFHTKGVYRLYKTLTVLTLGTFWVSPYLAPISCGPAKCLQNFASKLTSDFLVGFTDDSQSQLGQWSSWTSGPVVIPSPNIQRVEGLQIGNSPWFYSLNFAMKVSPRITFACPRTSKISTSHCNLLYMSLHFHSCSHCPRIFPRF